MSSWSLPKLAHCQIYKSVWDPRVRCCCYWFFWWLLSLVFPFTYGFGAITWKKLLAKLRAKYRCVVWCFLVIKVIYCVCSLMVVSSSQCLCRNTSTKRTSECRCVYPMQDVRFLNVFGREQQSSSLSSLGTKQHHDLRSSLLVLTVIFTLVDDNNQSCYLRCLNQIEREWEEINAEDLL